MGPAAGERGSTSPQHRANAEDDEGPLNEPLLLSSSTHPPRRRFLRHDRWGAWWLARRRRQYEDGGNGDDQLLPPQSSPEDDDDSLLLGATREGHRPAQPSSLVFSLLGHPYVRYSNPNGSSFLRQIGLAVLLGAFVGLVQAVGMGALERATAGLQKWGTLLLLKSTSTSTTNSSIITLLMPALGRASVAVASALLAAALLWYFEWQPETSLQLIVLGSSTVAAASRNSTAPTTTIASTPPQSSVSENDREVDDDDDDAHDAILQASWTAVFASGVVLAGGCFPLGPELALLALARILATVMVDLPYRWCLTAVDQRPPREMRPYQQQLWMPAALAATVGSVLPVHAAVVLGPLLVLELEHSTTTASKQQQHWFFVDDDEERHYLSTTRSRYYYSQQQYQQYRPDFMQVVTLQVVAALVASLFSQWIAPLWFPPTDPPKHYVTMDYHFHVWHLPVAVGLGLLCGAFGLSVWMLQSGWDVLRTRCGSHGSPIPSVGGMLGAALLAGLIQGSLLVVSPDAAGSGFSLLQGAFTSEADNTADSSSVTFNEFVMATSRQRWLLLAACRFVGLGTSLGLGLLGGPLIPMAAIGLCAGLAMGFPVDDLGQTSWLPLNVTVPCCVAACVVSLCPIPLTTCFALILVFGCAVEQSGPILLACLVAWAVTGGWGLLRNWEEQRLGLPLTGSSNHRAQVNFLEDEAATDEDEILRNIRSTIFGNV